MKRLRESDPIHPLVTLTTCYAPVERYLRFLESPGDGSRTRTGPGNRAAGNGAGGNGAGEAPVSVPSALDVFLMHQIASFLPAAPHVVDLLADATAGASTAFWSAHPGVSAVLAPSAGNSGSWREGFRDACREIRIDAGRVMLNGEPLSAGPLPGGTPVLFAIGPTRDGNDPAAEVRQIFEGRPDAIVLFLPLGRMGNSRNVEALLAMCGAGGALRLVAVREIGPFFASSEMAIVHAAGDGRAADVLERLAALYDGNFQFLNLAEAAVAALLGGRRAAGGGVEEGVNGDDAVPADGGRAQRYPELTERIRRQVEEAVPAGGTVLVISKGDDRLLEFAGRRGWHFPQDAQGTYAGHHPADSAAAIDSLEALRKKGAQFLLIPATAGWWLEYYTDFRRHLEQNYTVRVCRPETCVVFELRGGGTPGPSPAPSLPYPQLLEEIRKLVPQVIPPGATVLVVSKGDSQILDLGAPRAWHFPRNEQGVYLGHHPADSAAAIQHLESLRAKGADYFLLPSPYRWWLDHYADFRRHLAERYEKVCDDERCVIFRLGKRRRGLLRWAARYLGARGRDPGNT